MVTLLLEPFARLRDDPTATGNDRFEGYIIDLIDLIAKKLGKRKTVNSKIVDDYKSG